MRQPHHNGLADALHRAARAAGLPRWQARDAAPQTLPDVLNSNTATGALTVWAGASDRTVWGDPRLNHLFRSWHDWAHVRTGAGFAPAAEIALAEWQAAEAERSVGSAFARLVFLEIAGQASEYLKTGRFLSNQLEWTLSQL